MIGAANTSPKYRRASMSENLPTVRLDVDEERCETCHYWKRRHYLCDSHTSESVGDCRRHAPDTAKFQMHWHPNTYSTHWCGDYQWNGQLPKEATEVSTATDY
jgi:hypothetical protein